jgi:hypothetical protein
LDYELRLAKFKHGVNMKQVDEIDRSAVMAGSALLLPNGRNRQT